MKYISLIIPFVAASTAFGVQDTGLVVGPDGTVQQIVRVGGSEPEPNLSDEQILDAITVLAPTQTEQPTHQPAPAQTADQTTGQPVVLVTAEPALAVAPATQPPVTPVADEPIRGAAVLSVEVSPAPEGDRTPTVVQSEGPPPVSATETVAVDIPAGQVVAPSTVVSLEVVRPALTNDGPIEDSNVLRPVNGVITVAPRRPTGEPTLVPNPFDVRVVTPSVLDEYQMQATGSLFGGKAPVMYINGSAYVAGDDVGGGFTLFRVRSDGCVLSKDAQYFYIPIGNPIVVRLPKKSS